MPTCHTNYGNKKETAASNIHDVAVSHARLMRQRLMSAVAGVVSLLCLLAIRGVGIAGGVVCRIIGAVCRVAVVCAVGCFVGRSILRVILCFVSFIALIIQCDSPLLKFSVCLLHEARSPYFI